MNNMLISLSLVNVISFIIGIVTGFGIYLVILWKTKYHKLIKPTTINLNVLTNEQKDKLNAIVKINYKEYLKRHNKKDKKPRLTEGEKTVSVENYTMLSSIKSLIKEIPPLFYPDKERPELEIDIDQAFVLLEYLPKRCRELITDINIDGIENLKISTIISIVLLSKKFYRFSTAKLVKVAIKTFNICFMIRNIFYFPYWIKKGTSTSISKTFSNMIIYSFYDMLAKEIAYIYSRNL